MKKCGVTQNKEMRCLFIFKNKILQTWMKVLETQRRNIFTIRRVFIEGHGTPRLKHL